MLSTSKNIAENDSVRTFLNGLFDYAGLFPPASLSLAAAIEEYSSYRTGGDRWMIGPFVIPVLKLDELSDFVDVFDAANPLRLSVLFRNDPDLGEQKKVLLEDLNYVSNFEIRQKGGAVAEMIEMRVPTTFSSDDLRANQFTDLLFESVRSTTTGISSVFLEVNRDSDFTDRVSSIARSTARFSGNKLRMGMKIRCGGVNQEDYPSINELAQFIDTVTRAGVPFKATAGLHHPVRHFNEKAGVTMHGFFNVFFGAALASFHDLSLEEIESILGEVQPNAFTFTDSDVTWHDLSVPREHLASTRTMAALSIGSCSFDEPRQDMVDLSWLKTTYI